MMLPKELTDTKKRKAKSVALREFDGNNSSTVFLKAYFYASCSFYR